MEIRRSNFCKCLFITAEDDVDKSITETEGLAEARPSVIFCLLHFCPATK